MLTKKKTYVPPAIIFEADIETSAGTSQSYIGPNIMDPLKAESLGMDWPMEADFPDPED
jgi:hypothetical protein